MLIKGMRFSQEQVSVDTVEMKTSGLSVGGTSAELVRAYGDLKSVSQVLEEGAEGDISSNLTKGITSIEESILAVYSTLELMSMELAASADMNETIEAAAFMAANNRRDAK